MGYAIVHARNYFNMTCPDQIGDLLSVVFTAPYSDGSRADSEEDWVLSVD
jgi:hypothetical protein